jgi:hypothetical protein
MLVKVSALPQAQIYENMESIPPKGGGLPTSPSPTDSLPDPYRTHLDTKESDQRRALEFRLSNRPRKKIDMSDAGAPHLKEDKE